MNLTTTIIQTMTSREIAELTGKEHFHVKRDIAKVLAEAGIDPSKFGCTYLDAQNREQTEYRLPRRECDLVVSGYSVPYRLAIIDRWHELEQQNAQPTIPATPSIQIASEWLGMAQLLGVPVHAAQVEAVKQVELKTGIDFRPLLAASPAQDAIKDEDVMLEPTDIAKRAGLASGKDVNKLLASHGYQYRQNRLWEPTDKGKPHCQRHHWVRGSKSGYNYKWNYNIVSSLMGENNENN